MGLELLDVRLGGVPGGVSPFPLALLSPIALTSSLTETPTKSEGTSLKRKIMIKGIEQLLQVRKIRTEKSTEKNSFAPFQINTNNFWERLGFIITLLTCSKMLNNIFL